MSDDDKEREKSPPLNTNDRKSENGVDEAIELQTFTSEVRSQIYVMGAVAGTRPVSFSYVDDIETELHDEDQNEKNTNSVEDLTEPSTARIISSVEGSTEPSTARISSVASPTGSSRVIRLPPFRGSLRSIMSTVNFRPTFYDNRKLNFQFFFSLVVFVCFLIGLTGLVYIGIRYLHEQKFSIPAAIVSGSSFSIGIVLILFFNEGYILHRFWPEFMTSTPQEGPPEFF